MVDEPDEESAISILRGLKKNMKPTTKFVSKMKRLLGL